jgi:hypothetical protein
MSSGLNSDLDLALSHTPLRLRVRIERCSFCRREFRGVCPRPVRLRHESEHRYAVLAKVATS